MRRYTLLGKAALRCSLAKMAGNKLEKVPKMITPVRIQLRRTKGWRMPENTIKVDRSTPWGNPFVGAYYPTAEAVVARFKASLTMTPRPAKDSYMGQILDSIHELRGKNLACWCSLDAPCHADILLQLANAGGNPL